jgi:gluconokinase
MIILVMGVSGSGKTTIGKMLADAIRCSFLEGDPLHSKENIEKMSHGIPLTDSDRAPWLTAIRSHILESFKRGENLVVGCSALEQQYREFLAEGIPITWVYLKGSAELIRARIKHRPSHFMKADMLRSQFDALEEPSDAIVIDISRPPSAIVAQILAQLPRPRPTLRGRAPPHAQNKHARGRRCARAKMCEM